MKYVLLNVWKYNITIYEQMRPNVRIYNNKTSKNDKKIFDNTVKFNFNCFLHKCQPF